MKSCNRDSSSWVDRGKVTKMQKCINISSKSIKRLRLYSLGKRWERLRIMTGLQFCPSKNYVRSTDSFYTTGLLTLPVNPNPPLVAPYPDNSLSRLIEYCWENSAVQNAFVRKVVTQKTLHHTYCIRHHWQLDLNGTCNNPSMCKLYAKLRYLQSKIIKLLKFSSSSSCCDHEPFVDISRDDFHCRLKTLFSQSLSLHSHLSLPQADLLDFDHSVLGSHWRR